MVDCGVSQSRRSPAQFECEFFHNVSIHTSLFKSNMVSRTCKSETQEGPLPS